MNVVTVLVHSVGPNLYFSYCRSSFPKRLFLYAKVHISHKLFKIPGKCFQNSFHKFVLHIYYYIIVFFIFILATVENLKKTYIFKKIKSFEKNNEIYATII